MANFHIMMKRYNKPRSFVNHPAACLGRGEFHICRKENSRLAQENVLMGIYVGSGVASKSLSRFVFHILFH